jgi:hypothetical protein
MTHSAATVLARLAEHSIPAHILDLQGGARLVVSALGGRVYGPFFDDGIAENWLPGAFGDAASFAELVRSGTWNVGGDRWWVGPEIAYMIPDRADYWGSYTMPPDVDPGFPSLRVDGEAVTLDREMALTAFTEPRGTVTLTLTQEIRPEPSPLRHLRGVDLGTTTRYAGYSQLVTTRRTGGDALLVESWNLAQVRTPGEAIIPTTVSPAQVTDYYEPVAEHLSQKDRGAVVHLSGHDRFKIGFAAPHTTGRVGFVRADGEGIVHLVIRCAAVDPSAEYAEEPDFDDVRGDPLHLYDDDGGLGGFAELESRGRTFGGANSESESVDRVTTWWFVGPAGEINVISRTLLGLSAGIRHTPSEENR